VGGVADREGVETDGAARSEQKLEAAGKRAGIHKEIDERLHRYYLCHIIFSFFM